MSIQQVQLFLSVNNIQRERLRVFKFFFITFWKGCQKGENIARFQGSGGVF